MGQWLPGSTPAQTVFAVELITFPGNPRLAAAPQRILVTGGASCPDGIIQQVISRINGFYPAGSLRPIEAVLADLSAF